MSAPLKLDTEQLHNLATALDELTRITRDTGVDFTSYGGLVAGIGDSNLAIRLDGGRYVIEDRNGD